MKRRERVRRAEAVEEDERLARAVLAELRQGWRERRRTLRPRTDRRLLEAYALEDSDRLAWRTPEPTLADLLLGPDPFEADNDTWIEPSGARLREEPAVDDQRMGALGPPGETRRALALWTRYRLACLELLGSGGRIGDA